MARIKKENGSSSSTATIGFEATVLRGSASLSSQATLRSLSTAKDNRWLTADSRRALIEGDREMPNDEPQPPHFDIRGIQYSSFASLPGQLFYSTQIPVCLWFCGNDNTLDSANDARLFDGETEFSLVA